MDYRINNEAVIACVIAQVVKRGPYDIPFTIGIVNLLMQESSRNKALEIPGNNAKELKMLFGQLNGDLLGVIMNSMTMLIEGGCLKRQNEKLELTASGNELCQDMNNRKSDMLANIMNDVDVVLFKYDSIDLSSLYQQFWIAL